MRPVQIGLLGLGTVGEGTAKVLFKNAEEIARRAGREINIAHCCSRNQTLASELSLINVLTSDPFEVVNNPEVDIVVELFGGEEPALELVMTAIKNSKHVVTANKALIALHGNEIFKAAQDNGVTVGFEAGVAGGIPIIKTLREGLAANTIEWLAGIINGTGNFILTEMREKGSDFQSVLKQAQELGYAESDPTFDVEGIDAAHKLTILASIAFGIPLQFEKVSITGITGITPQDIEYANELGYRFKHLGIAKRTDKGVELRVHPTLIPKKQLLAHVNGVMNAVVVKGDAVGSTLHYGAGAGSLATASSVVADLVDITRALTTDSENRVPHLAFQPDALSDLPIVSEEDVSSAFYLRLRATDESGVLVKVTKALADRDISIEAFLQKEPEQLGDEVDIILLTNKIQRHQINAAISELSNLDVITEEITYFHVEMFSD